MSDEATAKVRQNDLQLVEEMRSHLGDRWFNQILVCLMDDYADDELSVQQIVATYLELGLLSSYSFAIARRYFPQVWRRHCMERQMDL